MRKLLSAALICLILLCMSACSSDGDVSADEAVLNEIKPIVLTDEQNEVLSMLTNARQEIMLFDYATDEEYESLEFWVEAYKGGKLVSHPSNLLLEGNKRLMSGRFSASITRSNAGYCWSLTNSIDGGLSMHYGETVGEDYASLSRAFGPILSAEKIERGKEILLYASIHSVSDIAVVDNIQRYLSEPELLNDCPFYYFIKCRFD